MNEVTLLNKFAETPIAIFFKHALKNRPYEAYCAANGLYGIPDLPFLLFESNNGPSFENRIINNMFVAAPIKTYVLATYVDSKKYWWTLRRAVVRYARRRRRSQTSMDLSLDPFGAAVTRMEVFDNGKKYTFKVSDLLNLIHGSLTMANEFICEPVPIKNPYTGLQFGKPTLYSIYLMLRESPYGVPPLFILFLNLDFDLKIFSIKYETILRDHVIKSYVADLTPSARRTEIRTMFSVVGLFNPFSKRCEPIFHICGEVFSEELDQFTPWLHLYFLHLYSLNTYYAHVSFRKLVKKMLRFREENPTFGMLKGRMTKKLSTTI
jgi:hypothetical protein